MCDPLKIKPDLGDIKVVKQRNAGGRPIINKWFDPLRVLHNVGLRLGLLGGFLALGPGIAFLNAGRLAAKVAKVIELGAAYLTTAYDVDMIDHRGVEREYAFDADAETDLANCHRLANAAVFAGDTDTLKGLQAFLVALLDPDVYAKRIARLKGGCVLF
jgi:hypothetical protein